MPEESAPPARLVSLDDLERLWQRQVMPFLQSLKQMSTQLIDEASEKHGLPMLARVQQMVTDTIAATLKSQEAVLWAQFKPALEQGGEALRAKTDLLLANWKQLTAAMVVDVFRVHVPDYSRWAGQRIMDYFLSGTLFCIAAVLAAVGGVLGLEAAGLPRYATYLLCGGTALILGLVFLKLRSRRWTGPLRADARDAVAAQHSGR